MLHQLVFSSLSYFAKSIPVIKVLQKKTYITPIILAITVDRYFSVSFFFQLISFFSCGTFNTKIEEISNFSQSIPKKPVKFRFFQLSSLREHNFGLFSNPPTHYFSINNISENGHFFCWCNKRMFPHAYVQWPSCIKLKRF